MARKTKREREVFYEGLLKATGDFPDLTFQVSGPKTVTAEQASPLLEGYLEAVKRTRKTEAVRAAAIMAERIALERSHATAERLKAAVRARLDMHRSLCKLADLHLGFQVHVVFDVVAHALARRRVAPGRLRPP